jgi:uncharacterized protein YbjT (DUF2867 family)
LLTGVAGAVRAAAVPHVVFLSSIGAQHADGTGPIRTVHFGEKALADTGAATTFVRAGYFMENWAAVLPAAKGDGVLPSFLPAAHPQPMVATRDIGAISARALLAGGRGRRVIELAGPVDTSPDDVAAALSRILGRTIAVAEAPLDAVVPVFKGFGVSEDIALLYREMYAGIIGGRVAWEGKGAEAVRGTTHVEEVLRALAG